jgi:hypothetical protein
MRPVGSVRALLTVACILTGCAQTFALGKGGSAWAADRPSVAAYGDTQFYLDGQLDQTIYDSRPETEQSEFEIVMTSACGIGDIYGCGLLFAWRALQKLLQFLENPIILALIVLCLPCLTWNSVREAIEKRRSKSKETARDSFIGPRLPTSGSELFIGPIPESQGRQVQGPDCRPL